MRENLIINEQALNDIGSVGERKQMILREKRKHGGEVGRAFSDKNGENKKRYP